MTDLPWYFWVITVFLFALMFAMIPIAKVLYRPELEAQKREEESDAGEDGGQSEEDV